MFGFFGRLSDDGKTVALRCNIRRPRKDGDLCNSSTVVVVVVVLGVCDVVVDVFGTMHLLRCLDCGLRFGC